MAPIPDPIQRIHHHPTWSPDVPVQKCPKTQDPVDQVPIAKNHLSGYNLTRSTLYVGIATTKTENGGYLSYLSFNDGTYSVDSLEQPFINPSEDGQITPKELSNALSDQLLSSIQQYEQGHQCKIQGAGITKHVVDLSPKLPRRLWAELDILPFIFDRGLEPPAASPVKKVDIGVTVDEEADSMARKCLMFFGPSGQPRLMVGRRNEVEVDASGHINMVSLQDYKNSVDEPIWTSSMVFAASLKRRGTKIAFFNSTPQGGGVALMRHALIRFFRALEIDCKWWVPQSFASNQYAEPLYYRYVPKPKPEIFRITKTNHNILQGVADPKEHLTRASQQLLDDWTLQNGKQFWLSEGGPLSARSEGGADIIIIDDPQMPSLVSIAKQQDPTRPVIYRSHIQIRSDLTNTPGTPASEVWDWVYSKIKEADIFISHPVRSFVPSSIDFKKVGYMPATTDWLDGLNKPIKQLADQQYYIHDLYTECFRQGMTCLGYPEREYIVQIARFDPSKGIPDVLAAYAEYRHTYLAKDTPHKSIPQLVIAGHGAIDDPDATLVYNQTLNQITGRYLDLKDDIVLLRLGPTDQLLNVLLSNAKIALQLSTREGFEVKVSEALRKGIPVIATNAGGIPLQVVHTKSGFIVEPGDYKNVAVFIHALLSNSDLYDSMSSYASSHVSPEVGTVGNALCWMYLADTLTLGNQKVEPDSAWINDMARKKAGVAFIEKVEVRLPRHEGLDLTESKKQARAEDAAAEEL
ncbi:glycosyltransferase family 4 protein [Venturia nashicola]|uniref:Glycosyltransferase family 4 protein n=1 Tax=Venturia nashicola TaxID=86259 RepID=A0A4Z1NJ54_9PEZI|nr:glycosyltransferase family 4 protein [Venturia nashicola]TLD23372.1 glycosyltransferase family 4 protein [Venturia nashicola]